VPDALLTPAASVGAFAEAVVDGLAPGARVLDCAAGTGQLALRGILIVTSRKWELVRRTGPGLQVADRLVERAGRRGLVLYDWTIPGSSDDPHGFEVAVALIGEDGVVETHSERLRFWPFTHEELDEDLRGAGLLPASSTYACEAERYTVIAVATRAVA
jgi:hypothetical protein